MKKIFVTLITLGFVAFLFFHQVVYLPENFCLGEMRSRSLFSLALAGIAVFGFMFWTTFAYFLLSWFWNRKFLVPVLAILLGLGLTFGTIHISKHLNEWVRLSALSRAIERASPIIEGIGKYQERTGSSPYLIQEIDMEIPTTNICGFRNFKYERYDWTVPANEEGQGNFVGHSSPEDYELIVEMPTDPPKLNVFVYLSSQENPTSARRGQAEPVGRWYYVRDSEF